MSQDAEVLELQRLRALVGSNAKAAPAHADDEIAALRALKAQVAAAPAPAPQQAKTFASEGAPPGRMATFGNALVKGATGFADMIPDSLVNVANLGIAGYGMGKHLLTGSNDLPDLIPSDKLSGYRKMATDAGLIRQSAEPTDMLGRVVDTTGQVLGGGGLNPKALASNAVRGQVMPLVRDVVAPLATSLGLSAGNEAVRGVDTGSDALDNTIKALVPLAAGSAPGAIVAKRGTAGDRAAAAVSGVTDEQKALARVLAQKAEQQGSPITGYEAIQAVTGLNPKMQTQQRLAEQSDAAAHTLTPIMQARPQNNAKLLNSTLDQIAPVEQFPDTLAGVFQKAAQGSIDAARADGNKRANPFYATTSNDPAVQIPSADWNSLTADPRVQAALRAVKSDPFSGLHNATDGSAQWLDAAKKWLDSQGQVKAQQGDRFAAGNRSGAANQITTTMDSALPDYAKARGIIADNMQNVVTPMEQGQIGKLSRSDDFKAQSETLLPNAPADVTPSVIDRTATTIGQQDPSIMGRFLAQDLRRKFNEASQNTQSGENVMGGAKFAANVSGNEAQKANLIQALKSSGVDPSGFDDVLGTFKAQGNKPPVNSATSANMAEGAQGKNLFTAPLQTIRAFSDQWTNGLAAKGLANALSSGGKSVDDVLQLARTNGTYSPLQQQMLINLLNSGQYKTNDLSGTQ